MKIEFEDIVLRCFESDDAEAIYKYRNDFEVCQGLVGFRPEMSRADTDEWIEFHRQNSENILWAISDSTSNQCFGHVGLYKVDYRMQKADLGICIGDKSRWGKGLGRKIVQKVLVFAFNQLHLTQVRLQVLAGNRVAVKLYEHLGFSQDGRLRREQFRDGEFKDVLLMSLLRQEWLSQQ